MLPILDLDNHHHEAIIMSWALRPLNAHERQAGPWTGDSPVHGKCDCVRRLASEMPRCGCVRVTAACANGQCLCEILEKQWMLVPVVVLVRMVVKFQCPESVHLL